MVCAFVCPMSVGSCSRCESFRSIGATRAMTQFIPPWGVHYAHYYGSYSSRCRARWQHWPHVSARRNPGRSTKWCSA